MSLGSGSLPKPPSHRTFQFGSIVLSSDFDSGNLSFAERANSVLYNIWIGTDHPDNNYRTWFYFWVEGVTKDTTVTFNIKNMHNQTRLLNEGLVPVYRNESDSVWSRVAHKINTSAMAFNSEGFLEFSFKHTFVSDEKTYLAFFYPWSIQDNNNLLNSLEQTAKNSHQIYFHRTTLVYSYEQRPVQLVTISSTDKITKNEENLEDKIMFPCKNRPKSFATQKKAIFFSARVHPGEVPGSHVMNGILKGLLQDTDIAKLLRDKFVFYMVPIINPDGVFRGHYRTDRNGVNLNRYYMSPSPKDHSPIYAIKKFVLHLHYTGRLFACMDMHAHATRKGTFIYGNYSTELKKQLQICLLPKILSLNSPNFEYQASNFTEINMYCKDKADAFSKEGAARVAFFKLTKNPYCWTLECNYNMGRIQNQICDRNSHTAPAKEQNLDRDLIANYQNLNAVEAKQFYTIQTYENLGWEILESFLDLVEQHPCSRINNPNSRFKSISNLKLNLLVALMKMVPYHFEPRYRKLLYGAINDKPEISLRAIRALQEIFIRNRAIENIDDYLKNERPPLSAPLSPPKPLPRAKRLPILNNFRLNKRNVHQKSETNTEATRSEKAQKEVKRCAIVLTTDDIVDEVMTNLTGMTPTNQANSFVSAFDKPNRELRLRFRDYIERLNVRDETEPDPLQEEGPTLKVYSTLIRRVNLRILRRLAKYDDTTDATTSSNSSRQRPGTRSLMFNRRVQERNIGSPMRRNSKLISQSLKLC